MIQEVSKTSLAKFLSQKPCSVIHFDASWDGYRQTVVEKIRSLESEFRNDVSFGFIDCDVEPDYAREVGVINVPAVAYYQGGKFICLVIGQGQDIVQNIQRLQRGESLNMPNRVSRG